MGRFDFEFPKEFDAMLRRASNLDEIAPKMIDATLPIYRDSIKKHLTRSRQSGALIKSVSFKRAKEAKSGGWIGNITFNGKDNRGSPNIIKAAGLEYGSSKQNPTPFLAAARNDVNNKVVEVMQEVFEREVTR